MNVSKWCPLSDINWCSGFWHGWIWLTGATDLEAILKRKKEHYRRELQEQIAEKQSHRRCVLRNCLGVFGW